MFLLVFAAFLIAVYFYGTRNFNYWKKKGIKYDEPIIFFGSNLTHIINKHSLSERFAELHNRYPGEKFVGYFESNNPALLVRDPELVKTILVTDFKHFHRRGVSPHKEDKEPLLKNLFTVDGDAWKLLRQRMTPAFSSAKLKAMFPLIVERTERLLKIIDNIADTGVEVDVRDLMARYTTDFIGACGFGIDSKSLDDENSDFRKLGKRIFQYTTRDILVHLLKRTFPNFDILKNLYFFAPEIEKKTVSLVQQIMRQRNYMPSGRNDFIDMMLELKQKGKMVGESVDKRNPDETPKIVELELDDKLLAAQVFIFFAAGFETSSSSSSFLLHQLAFHPDEQEKVQKEIDDVLAKYDGKLSYDAVKDMKYLEMAYKESNRVFASPGFLMRKTSTKYTFPGTDLTVEPYTGIVISTQAFYADENFFEDPKSYKPLRFHPDNADKLAKSIYMPFGDGPRSCIGERLGIMQSLAGVAALLRHFSVSPSKSTKRYPSIDPTSTIIQNVLGGLPLALTRRKKVQ
ncbi:cytochrome P450 6B2-like [Leptidea sinapis]|uniref:cytochrome P450 6B2-like n=1 Tax=Leptidea sinapis TaxID=189913 RepID=UPI0021274FE6|nr:cytochrome P450 6B2-like [Leptidea sinapis]